MDNQPLAPPPGFAPHDRKSPLTDPWEPLYSRKTEAAVVLGLWAGNTHCNGRGFVHGGLIGALCDNAMGLSCARTIGQISGLVTVSLSVDFLASAFAGQWLEFDTVFVKPGRSLAFAQAFVTAAGHPVARANAVFRVLHEHPRQVAA